MPNRNASSHGRIRWQPGLIAVITIACLIWLVPFLAAQNIQGTDLNGKLVDVVKASSAKPVVLIFVRTDCPISNRYAPTLQKLQSEYSSRAAFWLVYPDKRESSDAIRKHIHDFGYTTPVLRDSDHALVKAAQTQVTPEVAIFTQGKLVYHGRIDDWYESFGRARPAPTTHEMRDALEAVTSGKPAPLSSAQAIGCSIMDMQ